MLFHTTFKPKAGYTNEDQKLVMKLWAEWSPPPGFTIKSFHVSPDGRGFTITETESVEAMLQVIAPWSSVLLDYEITPVLEVEKAVPIVMAGIAKRG